MTKILLVGYYGKGNFGDDVLFTTTYNLIKTWKQDSHITVLCDNYQEDYLPKLIHTNIDTVSYGDKGEYDFIIHGGGGTFFDFKEGTWMDYIMNMFLKFIGFKYYAQIHDSLRKYLNKELVKAKKRYGFGIGIGTYTNSSKKLKYNIPVIMDFDYLMLRDQKSEDNLLGMGIDIQSSVGSDLAFFTEHWVPEVLHIDKHERDKKKLGIILRDWDDSYYTHKVINMLNKFKDEYLLHIFIFDKREDKEMIALSKNYETTIWDPMEVTLKTYCEQLASQDVLITTRAHGAICGAVLGVPSIVIEIETKLKIIHKLLPYTTRLISMNEFVPEHLNIQIKKILKCELKEIKKEITLHKDTIQSSMNHIFVESHI